MLLSFFAASALWRQRLIFIILLACLAGFLWWPRGLNIPPTEDDWNNYARVDKEALIPTESALPYDASRPIIYLWWHIAYAISPESMLAVNWLTALTLIVRAISFYVIVSYLTQKRSWAVAAACLMIVIPLDFGVYEKGTFHIQIVTSLYFMAAAFFLTHAHRMRPVHLIFIWGILVLACGTYENIYPMIGVTPLLLVLKERHLTRRIILLSLAWWIVPAICALLFFIPSLTATVSYQRNLLRNDISPLISLRTISDAYIHVFAKAWYAALRKEPGDFLLLRGLLGGIVALYIWIAVRVESPHIPRLPMWLIFVTSLLLTGAGFAMYVPTPLLSGGGGIRVHFLTTGGASLALVLITWFIGRSLRLSLIFPLLMGLLIVLSLGSTMNIIRAGTLNRANQQGMLLSSLAAQAPHIQPKTTLVFLFTPDVNNPFPISYVAYLQNAVSYIYREYTLHIVVCYDSNCTADVWQTIDPTEAIVFQVKPSLNLEMLTTVPELGSAYHPQNRFDKAASDPVRIQTLYSQGTD